MSVLVATGAAREAAQQQQLWSDAAGAAKRSISRWREIALTLVLASAVVATLATQVAHVSTIVGRLLAIASGVAVGILPVIRSFKLSQENLADWTRLRSVAESIKSEMYRYLARVPPYADHDADAQLLDAIGDIADTAKDLQSRLLDMKPVDPAIPPVTDAPSYVRNRVDQQIANYYLPKAEQAKKRLSLAEGIEFVLALLAVVLGVIAATGGITWAAAWVPVVTTAAGAIAAHMAASHYADNLTAYTATAAQLRRLKEKWMTNRQTPGQTAPADEDLVRNAEQVMSIENRSWMAKLSSN